MSSPGASALTAGDVLTLDELRRFRRTSTLRGAGLVLHAWAVIAGAMILHAAWPSLLTLEGPSPWRRLAGPLASNAALLGVAAGRVARLFLAPYWVNYHLEHHLLVFVPCWKLRAAHALLLAQGYGPRMETASGYGDLIRRAAPARRH